MIKIARILCQWTMIIANIIQRAWVKYVTRYFYRSQLGYCGKNVDLRFYQNPGNLSNVYLYDNTNIYHHFKFISVSGKFIMKRNSGAAAGLTVITGNHQRITGVYFKDISSKHTYDIEKDVIVCEDVWLGANVTLLSGVTIGRGATIGANSVCFKSIPPYAMVVGNPAKIVGFNFTPEEIIEHEKMLYKEEERIPLSILEKNYEKYYLSKLKEIRAFLSLSC